MTGDGAMSAEDNAHLRMPLPKSKQTSFAGAERCVPSLMNSAGDPDGMEGGAWELKKCQVESDQIKNQIQGALIGRGRKANSCEV